MPRRPQAESGLETYLREINLVPLLTAEEEKTLAVRVGDGDQDRFYLSMSDPSSGSEALGAEVAFDIWNEFDDANPTATVMFEGEDTVKNTYLDDVSLVAIPEPATMGLLGLSFAGMAALRRRRRS